MHSFLPATGKESLCILCETKSSVKKSDVGEKKNCVIIEMKLTKLIPILRITPQPHLHFIKSSPRLNVLYFQLLRTCRTSSRRRLRQSRQELLHLQNVDQAQQQQPEPRPARLWSSRLLSSRALTRAPRQL